MSISERLRNVDLNRVARRGLQGDRINSPGAKRAFRDDARSALGAAYRNRTRYRAGAVAAAAAGVGAAGLLLAARNRRRRDAEGYELTQSFDGPAGDTMGRLNMHRDGKNVAYLAYRPVSSEGDGPWVSGLHVSPEYRGKGLGKRLMKEMEKRHPGETLRLRARPYKDEAVSQGDLVLMYSNMGYSPYDPDEPTRMAKQVPGRFSPKRYLHGN